jgi:type VI protein secretion system component VasF
MEQAPTSAAPASQPGCAAAPNDAVRTEAAALLAERERLDVELARVREALAYEDREATRRVVDEALRKIARHLEREGRLLEAVSAAPASPRPRP